MSSWAAKRQASYISIVIAVLLVVAGLPIYFTFFHHTASCSDGIQNQNETGIDCGGVCNKVCKVDTLNPPDLIWARSFEVTTGLYNAVADIQNPNLNYLSDPVTYEFKLYDKDNALIADRTGSAVIPPNRTFPIFEAGIDTGTKEVARTFFQFTSDPVWQAYNQSPSQITVVDNNLTGTDGTSTPRLDATLENDTVYNFNNIEVVAILYDENDNAQAVSRTIVDQLYRGDKKQVTFTWDAPFNFKVSKIDIIPKLSYSTQ